MKGNYYLFGDNELPMLQGTRYKHGNKRSSLERECKRRSQRALTPRIRVKPQAKGFGS